jgi:hypothetical protein
VKLPARQYDGYVEVSESIISWAGVLGPTVWTA